MRYFAQISHLEVCGETDCAIKARMKPLGAKSYGSIPHLPDSRMGPADHHCPPGQASIATAKLRNKHDRVIVTEKLDGTNVAVARVGDEILALVRAGYLASSSQYEQHLMFARWVEAQADRFRAALSDGERFCGEWLVQAHGTRYQLEHEPFVAFDLMAGPLRYPWDRFLETARMSDLVTARVLSDGPSFSVADALLSVETSGHGALDPVEGAVWRVEQRGVFDFMVKYVRPEKFDGLYLPEKTGSQPIWNWHPDLLPQN